MRRILAHLVPLLLVVMAAGMPAATAKPKNGSGGSGDPDTSSAISCSEMLGDGTTMSLQDVRAGMNADYSATGGGIGIAVIDTGINLVGGLAGRSKVIDGPDLSFDAEHENLRYRDLHGHGTNMAAVIAANNSDVGDGLAPGSHLVNVKVGAGNGAVDVSQVIAAIDWVVQNRDLNGNNIRVISLSYNTDASQDHTLDPLSHAIENAWRHGIVVVVAGGNDGRGIQRLGNPASNPYVIAVGAAEQGNNGTWRVPSWTSTGDGVRDPDIVAPGASVLSAGVAGSYLAETYPQASCTARRDAVYLRGSGTSQAAAAVAGGVAMLLEARPELTPDQVKYLLTSTAVDLGHQVKMQGHGLVDIGAAMTAGASGAEQSHLSSTGLGSLDAARGTDHVGYAGNYLEGEVTAFGTIWNPEVWAAASSSGTAWSDQIYGNGDNTWQGGTWTGSTWTGSTWTGSTWTGSTWTGSTWTGSTWTGSTWTGSTWTGSTWR